MLSTSCRKSCSYESNNAVGKISGDDKSKIADAVKETLDWLEEHSEADKEELSQKQKDLEAVCNPIITKLYQEHGGSPGGAPGGGKGGDYYDDDADAGHDEL